VQNGGMNGAMFLLLGVLTSVPILVKIDFKNATVRVRADGQTQTGFICPTLYAIATKQMLGSNDVEQY